MFKDVDDMASRLDVSESGIWTQLALLRATEDVATYACEQEPSVTMDPIGNVLSLMQNVLAMDTLGTAARDDLAEGVLEADVKLTADARVRISDGGHDLSLLGAASGIAHPFTACELDGLDGMPLASKTLKGYYAKADVQTGSACQYASAINETESDFTESSRPVPAG